MKNRFGLLAAWFLATALAVGVASQAVGLVADRAVGIPVQVPIAVGGQSSSGPINVMPTDPESPTISSSSTPATTMSPPTASTTTTSVRSTTTPTVATATTTTTTIPPTTTTSPPPLDSRTFFPPGGQVSVACAGPETIKYLSAVPQSGWSLELKSSGPESVRVEFESGEEEEESEIEIVCRHGQLQEEISD